jgi:2-(3-amino-3-carboxypropyl)histidine synthase
MLSQRALTELKAKGNRRVIVQLPEGLKPRAWEIARELEKAGFEPVVSGDACFGACDLVTEEGATTLHIAHSRMLADERVVYEEWPHDVPLDKAVKAALPLLKEKSVALATTVQHLHNIKDAVKLLEAAGKSVVLVPRGERCAYDGQVLGCDFSGAKQAKADAFLFIGSGRFHPIGLAYYTKRRVVRADPFTGEAEEIDSAQWEKEKALRMTKAMKAKRFGVVVSTKPGQRNEKAAKEVVTKLRRKGFDAVIILSNFISPDALTNLALDAYVITACPRIVIDDWKNYPMPILLPDEV